MNKLRSNCYSLRGMWHICGLLILSALLQISTANAIDFDPADIIFHYHGQEPNSFLGYDLTSLGDINGDGFDDIAMSSWNPGGIHVFFGGNPVDSFPDMYLAYNLARFADPIDLDGDGTNDVIGSAIFDPAWYPTGALYFFKGYGDSLASVPYDSVRPVDSNYSFGTIVATGYVDDDALGDFLTWNKNYPYGPVLLYYSGCPALDKTAEWTFSITGYSHGYSGFGFVDFDGDGSLDIYVGMHADLDILSYVYIFRGPVFDDEPDVIIAHPTDINPFDPEYFAWEVVNYGDVDGDGWEDLGVLYGNVPLIYLCGPNADTLYDHILVGISSEMSAAGDINNDGYNDLLGGDNRVMSGVVDVYLGGTEFDEDFDMSIYRGDLPPLFMDRVGYRLSPAGDFNGDGYDDFMFACQGMGSDWGDVFVVQGGPYLQTDVDDAEPVQLPNEFNLQQNYPNPFNASTRIEFSLPRTDTITLSIFNILGQKIATLIDGQTYPAGSHILDWDGRLADNSYAPSGVYFYKLTTSSTGESRKMVMIK